MPLSKSENRASILETMARWMGRGASLIIIGLALFIVTCGWAEPVTI